MEQFKIYLCGGMAKFGKDHFDEGNAWRVYCKKFFEDCSEKAVVINPNDYFNFKDEPEYESSREVMEFDLYKVRHSDLIIVNFNDPYSLGTMAEIAIAYEKKIPIIGLNEERCNLHPWQRNMCNRIFYDIGDLVNYVYDFYLV